MYVNQCPRCGSISFEHLATHSYCWECNYSPESDLGLRAWRKIEFPRKPGKPNSKVLLGRQVLNLPDPRA